MWLQWAKVRKGRRSDVEAECLGVLIRSIKCIPQIHEKGIALPTEAILDEGVRKMCPVEEVCRGAADRVRAPQFELWTGRWELVDLLGNRAEENGHRLAHDLATGSGLAVSVGGYRTEGREVKLECTLGDAKHGCHRAKDSV
jgi:hypothetical protein